MSRPRLRWIRLAWLLPLLALLGIAALLFVAQGGLAAMRVPAGGADATDPALVERGRYLARIGNCVTCHTVRGRAPYAGGRAFASRWGTLYSSNLTPSPRNGLGDWSRAEFRHAMRHGVSRTGVLYPAFPYANFSRLRDEDLDALYAFLRTLPAHDDAPPANTLAFPAGMRSAVLGWRMLFHRPQPPLQDLADRPAAWNRGRYLVDGIGHCDMCHGTRGALASLPRDGRLDGGRIPGQDWHAPPLDRDSLARYDDASLAGYLQSGVSIHGAAYGPMAEVVYTSLQHLTADDAIAVATYLRTVPPAPRDARAARSDAGTADVAVATAAIDGAALYDTHCADCHGSDGRGRDLDYPPLAGNPLVTGDDPINTVRIVLFGGVPPTTAANPRPYSMPPFADRLDDAQTAAVISHVRRTWGNDARPVEPAQVTAMRGLPLE